MQIAYLCILHLAVKAEFQKNPSLKNHPLIISGDSSRSIMDTSLHRVKPGTTVASALSQHPNATILKANSSYYEEVFDQVLCGLEHCGANVEPIGLGFAYLDITGLSSLHGSSSKLLSYLVSNIPSYLRPQIGFGVNKFTAYIATVTDTLLDLQRSKDLSPYLSPLSVNLLPIAKESKERLHSFGLQTLGHITSLGIDPMQAYFGWKGRFFWELSMGIDQRPLLARRQKVTITTSMSLTEPISSIEALLAAIEVLLNRAFLDPAMKGKSARITCLSTITSSGSSWTRSMVFREPISEVKKAAELIGEALRNKPPQGAVEELTLQMLNITNIRSRQISMWESLREEESLKSSITQLIARTGDPSIYTIRSIDPWSPIPEERMALIPYVS